MRRRSAAVANDPVAAEAARDCLSAGGSAVGAVVSGYFAAAGAHGGVLLGPVSIVVGGTGVGARSFDGRLRQPGVGAKRPRGTLAADAVPDAARVAVPTSVSALAVALAYDGGQSLSTVVKPGIARAQRSGATGRAGVLRLVRGAGAASFADTSFVRALLRVAGPSQGGQLSPADFAPPTEVDTDARQRTADGKKLLETPWASEHAAEVPEELGAGCAVCAVDVRGVFAALCYRRVVHGFVIDELELEAPLAAVPVRRGVTRTPPGARLPVPAPIAIVCDAQGRASEVIAAPGAERIVDTTGASLWIRRSAATQEVEIVGG